MAITTQILYTNNASMECIISITDDPNESSVAIDAVNIGLQKNPDGTVNTAHIKNRVKDIVYAARTPESNSHIYFSDVFNEISGE